MFFRFAAALLLVVSVSMMGVVLEKQTLRLRRAVTRQYYQTDLLLEIHARHRLRTQQLTAPAQLAQTLSSSSGSVTSIQRDDSGTTADRHAAADRPGARLPLLRWQQPVNPPRID